MSEKVSVNAEAIRAAVRNCKDLKTVAFEIPVVDPKTLTLDSEIYKIAYLALVSPGKKATPDSSQYCVIQPITVETLSTKGADKGCINVNGLYDLSREAGKVVSLDKCYVSDKEVAIAICEVITLVQLERVEERQEEIDYQKKFWKEQIEKKHY